MVKSHCPSIPDSREWSSLAGLCRGCYVAVVNAVCRENEAEEISEEDHWDDWTAEYYACNGKIYFSCFQTDCLYEIDWSSMSVTRVAELVEGCWDELKDLDGGSSSHMLELIEEIFTDWKSS